MGDSLSVLYNILPVLLLFGLGILIRKFQIFSPTVIEGFKGMVVNIALPSLLFIAFSTLELRPELLLAVVSVFLICTIMVVLGWLIGRMLKIRSPYFAILMGGFETGMIGYAIFIAVFGVENVERLALIDLGQVVFVFFVLIALLMRLKGERYSPADLFRRLATSPVIIAIFLGILAGLINSSVGLSDAALYQSIVEFITMLGNLTVPLICIVIGYELQISRGNLGLPLLTIAIRKTLLIIFALLLNHFVIRGILELPRMYEYAVLTMFVLPPPFVIPLFMTQDEKEQRYVTATLSLSVPISAVVFIVITILMM